MLPLYSVLVRPHQWSALHTALHTVLSTPVQGKKVCTVEETGKSPAKSHKYDKETGVPLL